MSDKLQQGQDAQAKAHGITHEYNSAYGEVYVNSGDLEISIYREGFVTVGCFACIFLLIVFWMGRITKRSRS